MNQARKNLSQRIKNRCPEFEKEWNKLIRESGAEMVNYMKDRISTEFSLLKDLSAFKFKLVIDNNFIFGQIKGSIKKREGIEKSLLYRLLISKSVEIFAPPQLSKELHEKIAEVLDQQDQEIALSYATYTASKN